MHLIRNKIIYNADSNGTYQIFVLRIWNSFTIDIALVCDWNNTHISQQLLYFFSKKSIHVVDSSSTYYTMYKKNIYKNDYCCQH